MYAKKYAAWGFILLACWAACGALLYFVYEWIGNAMLAHYFPKTELVLGFETISWLTPAIFLGLAPGGLLCDSLMKRWLGPAWEEFLYYSNLQYKIDSERVTKYLLMGFGAIGLALTVLFFDFYTVFTPDKIYDSGLLSLGVREYPYSQVKEILYFDKVYAPNGDIAPNPYCVIVFQDGSRWNSRNNMAGSEIDPVLDLLEDKTDIEIRYQEVGSGD